MKKSGIVAIGNWIIDHVKIIDQYPEQDALANIETQSSSNGGSAYNLLKNLAKLKANFPLHAVGLVGNDSNGQSIFQDCIEHGIDTTYLQKTNEAATSYTDVMTVKSTGRRTFFHQRGANTLLDSSHVVLEMFAHCKLLHLGYLLLLDKFDVIHEDGSTEAARLLKKAQTQGLITAADVVSESSDRFKSVVLPSLPYIDILFANEYEASKITGITLQHPIEKNQLIKMAQWLLKAGVKKWVIIHLPQGVVAVGANGEIFTQGSVAIPPEKIVGAAGAGDAFAAGVLFAYHEGESMQQCLEAGVCSAATSLTDATCSDGILPLAESKKWSCAWGFRDF